MLTLTGVIVYGGIIIYNNPRLPNGVVINCKIPEYVKGPFPTIETKFIAATPEFKTDLKAALFGTEHFTVRSMSHIWDMNYGRLQYRSNPDSFLHEQADKFIEKVWHICLKQRPLCNLNQ